MKRIIFLVSVLLLITTSMVFSLTNTLIDFTLLGADYPQDNPKHNRKTIMNFKDAAGSTFTDEEKKLMLVSLALDEWRVALASSSATVKRMANSICKEASTAPNASPFQGEEMKSRTILGVRVLFPESNFNSYAIVKPPFEVQAYQDQNTVADNGDLVVEPNDLGNSDMFDGYGVIKNVGIIKSIDVTVYGANFPHGLELVLQDENYEQSSYHIAYLNFDGWATHTWTNPNYIEDVRNRQIKVYPLYPREIPYKKFIGFVIYRDANTIGGDFITYFKDVKVTYDEAIKTLDNPQIEDEKIWGILRARTDQRRKAEYRRLGAQQVLELLEDQKKHSTTADTAATTTTD
jgi:hypothetical protein